MTFRAMPQNLLLIDTLLRGMTVGAEVLIALVFLSRRPLTWRRGLGAAFILAVAAYIIKSSPALSEAIGPVAVPFAILATIAPVIFWWFALALFDDSFRMRWPALIPLVFVAQLVVAYFAQAGGFYWTLSVALARAVMIAAFGHAMYTALRYLNDDLIEGRRRFRVIFAVAVAVTGLVISYFETIGLRGEPPPELLLFQAASFFVMTLGFGAWLLGMRAEVLDGRAGREERAGTPAPQTAERLRPADRPAYERLTGLMAEGVWREEGLTVAALAARVGVPEHHLRALINGQLGARNFSAFLNSYRLEEAKRLLGDPHEARKQILQIALDVGYGSIAPFNRAFKEATGKTPTEFRKEALGEV